MLLCGCLQTFFRHPGCFRLDGLCSLPVIKRLPPRPQASNIVRKGGVVQTAGLEPATNDLEDRCSIHLSYVCMWRCCVQFPQSPQLRRWKDVGGCVNSSDGAGNRLRTCTSQVAAPVTARPTAPRLTFFRHTCMWAPAASQRAGAFQLSALCTTTRMGRLGNPIGAIDGTRTRIASLEGKPSAIDLLPHRPGCPRQINLLSFRIPQRPASACIRPAACTDPPGRCPCPC